MITAILIVTVVSCYFCFLLLLCVVVVVVAVVHVLVLVLVLACSCSWFVVMVIVELRAIGSLAVLQAAREKHCQIDSSLI